MNLVCSMCVVRERFHSKKQRRVAKPEHHKHHTKIVHLQTLREKKKQTPLVVMDIFKVGDGDLVRARILCDCIKHLDISKP